MADVVLVAMGAVAATASTARPKVTAEVLLLVQPMPAALAAVATAAAVLAAAMVLPLV